MKKRTTIIWCFTDGKKGHENQSMSLISQLSSKIECAVEIIDIPKQNSFLSALILNNLAVLKDLKKPDLLVGAGHKTHLYILYSKLILLFNT